MYIAVFIILAVLYFYKKQYCNQKCFCVNFCKTKILSQKKFEYLQILKDNMFELYILFVFFVLLSFRDLKIGVDLQTYQTYFEDLIMYRQIWDYEFMFKLLVDFIYFTGLSFRWLLIFEAFMFIVACYKLASMSKDKLLSLLILFSIGYFSFAACVLRQMIAFTFVIISYKNLLKEEYYKYWGYLTIAFLFHRSAILLVITFIFKKLKFDLKKMIVVFVLALVVLTNFRYLVYFLGNILKISYFKDYTFYNSDLTLSNWLSLTIEMIALVCLYFYAKHKNVNNNAINSFSFWQMFLFILTRLTANVLQQLFINRLTIYTVGFIAVLLPNLLGEIKNKKERNILTAVLVLLLFIYMYKFYYIDDYYLVNPYFTCFNS